MSKYMSRQKTIVAINVSVNCFNYYIYILQPSCFYRFDHSLFCRGSPKTTYITFLACWALFVYWYQQYVTVHHVPKCMSCHKVIVVMTNRAHCFHDYIYITPILLLHGLSTPCVVGHLLLLLLLLLFGFVCTLSSLVPAMCNLTSLVQVHVLPQNHCGNDCERKWFSWLHTYYVHLAHAVLEYYMNWINPSLTFWFRKLWFSQ